MPEGSTAGAGAVVTAAGCLGGDDDRPAFIIIMDMSSPYLCRRCCWNWWMTSMFSGAAGLVVRSRATLTVMVLLW